MLKGVKVQKVSCGRVHTVAITNNFETFSWGSGAGYRLGHGENLGEVHMPKRVDALKDLTCVDVQCASWYTIVKVLNAPMDVPKVDNDNIADEELNQQKGLQAIEEVDGRVSDEEGHQDQSILQMPGLYSWGSGSHGQLGQGATKLSPSPQVIQTLINEKVVPKQFSCGEKHVAMLSEEGSIWTWGCVLGLGRPIPLKNDVVQTHLFILSLLSF